jgi:hypothetical protein
MQTVDRTGRVVRTNRGLPDLAQEFRQIGGSLRSENLQAKGRIFCKFVFNDRFVFSGKP